MEIFAIVWLFRANLSLRFGAPLFLMGLCVQTVWALCAMGLTPPAQCPNKTQDDPFVGMTHEAKLSG